MEQAVLVVIPTYNEAENLADLACELLDLRARVDLLVVDDASPDGTAEIARGLHRRFGNRVRLHRREAKLGLGSAYRDGFRRGIELGYSRIAQMDADFSHRPRDLPRLIEGLSTADLVIGSRYVPGGRTEHWGFCRRLVSRGGSLYARTCLGVSIRDLTGGFKVWRRRTLVSIDLASIRSNGYCFQIETTFRAARNGARIVEVPIVFPERSSGRSKMSGAVFLEAVWRVPMLRLRGFRSSA